ncbi:Transaminated amino acid decarboxylase [Cyberlindnera fabianii]|uniref:Transaminated amino acid decarboxylase n=1 Tax=Cyberlindnera fabianii TaxID=36022 RepID=A0A1V2L3H1_CYBFA|nr:Transaminated amino acid decarboxylase [Cyberlindnera fabianii]
MTVAETKRIQIGTYIFQRLAQVENLKSIFGVPGDFNLPFLEHIYNVPQLNWIGNCNELNAGYAADGYARINGLGVLTTTFGVGELSALNAVSGAYVEGSPVLHIVGTSATTAKRANNLGVHHLIPNKNTWDASQPHDVYEKMVAPFACVIEKLYDENMDTLQTQIDNAIETVYKQSRPGYIFLPANMANMAMEYDPSKPLELGKYFSNVSQAEDLAQKVLDKLYEKEFAVIADQWWKTRRAPLNKFVKENKLHCFSSYLGKSILDESNERFHGSVAGNLSCAGSREALQKFELAVHFGVVLNEMNNFGYWYPKDDVKEVIEVGKDFVRLDGELHTGVDGEAVFDFMMTKLDASKIKHDESLVLPGKPGVEQCQDKSKPVTQISLAATAENYLRPNDVLVSEMCSFLFSTPDIKLPSGLTFISQNYYGSIGFALPATLGASLAVKDSGEDRRVILVEGDGSSQMTIQELSSMIKYDVKPTILLLNNEGYSVERVVLGPTRAYNDIQKNWKWTELFKTFGDVEGKSVSTRVDSVDALEEALGKDNDKLKFIEVGLEKLDVPWRFGFLCGKAKK